ncbi:MAG: hypothetical protein AB7S26_20745 [Sandaracinaceae bacterium]
MMERVGGLVVLVASMGCGSRTAMDMPDPAGLDASTRDAHVDEDAATEADADVASCTPRRIRIAFTPTARAQLAVGLEGGDAFRTIALTDAVARRGIGNRPGAMQMNSGFRWPYGRREGALPYWAHRRVELGGAAFPRVVFGERSEGHASGTIGTNDEYFCQPFDRTQTDRDHLDAVSCASPLHTDKGRFITEDDVAAGYSEPFETESGEASERPLGLTSLYPPRRDVALQAGDHPDVGRFASEAVAAMPELDAVTMATPARDTPVELVYDLDASLPDGDYDVFVEANTEGDYGGGFDPETYPTPSKPPEAWDFWSQTYGYPYRGQPSVIYRVTIEIRAGRATTYTASAPVGRMDPHGLDATMLPMAPMVDDPEGAPGSGADRLRMSASGLRLTITTECR